MKKITRQMAALGILYVIWIIVAIWYSMEHKVHNMKFILFGVSILFTGVLWILWKRLIKAAQKEQEDENTRNGKI